MKLVLSSNNSQALVARELGIKDNLLYGWLSKYRGEVLSTDHPLNLEQELEALRKEVAQLKQEREILKKAAVGL